MVLSYIQSSSASKKVIPQNIPLLNWLTKFMNRLKTTITYLEVFIDLSKVFDTIHHRMLLKKLENYGIKGTNLSWFRSHLTNRKQCIQITNDSKNDLRSTICGVLQGSILGPLIFLVYVNDLPSSSKISNPIMFAEDTNLFYEHKNVIKLFATVNEKLTNIND